MFVSFNDDDINNDATLSSLFHSHGCFESEIAGSEKCPTCVVFLCDFIKRTADKENQQQTHTGREKQKSKRQGKVGKLLMMILQVRSQTKALGWWLSRDNAGTKRGSGGRCRAWKKKLIGDCHVILNSCQLTTNLDTLGLSV